MGEGAAPTAPTARALAGMAWEAEDAFLDGGRHVLHREAEFVLTGRLPPASTVLAPRSAVVSAEPGPGSVTWLTVTTELVGPGGEVVGTSRSTVLVGSGAWRAALAV